MGASKVYFYGSVNEQKPVNRVRQPVWVSGIMVVSMFLSMAIERYYTSAGLGVMVIYLVSFLSFILAVLLAPLALWRSTKKKRDAMQSWWWLSVPYSVAFPLSVVVFQMSLNWHTEPHFILVYLLAAVSSAVWALVAIYRMVVSHTIFFNLKQAVMLGLVVIAGILFLILLRV